MRKINIGVSVAPPNVVHTSPYVAKELGFFAKRCIDANIIQFEGGQSPTVERRGGAGHRVVVGAATSRSATASRCSRSGASRRACRRPTWFAGHQDRQGPQGQDGSPRPAAASAASTGAWAARCSKSAGLTVDDAQFIAGATAGRLPGLIAGQIDGVALHPEDVYLAKKKKPTLHLLVQLVDLMPNYMFNAYGASIDWIANATDALLRDTVAAMIEANRTMYRDKAKVVPIIVKATDKPKDAVEYRHRRSDQELRLVGQRRASMPSARNGRSTTASRTATSRPTRSRRSSRSPTVELAKEAVEVAGGRSRSASARVID